MGEKVTDLSHKAFVLMPFDPVFDKIFNDLIKPPLEKSGYDVQRADSLDNQQNILKDIIRGIKEADLIIADLTGLNPNVFYELGIAHTMEKPTILLTQSIKEVPFDLKSYRLTQYSTTYYDAANLSERLSHIAEKAKSGNIGFGNPVTDFIPAMKTVETKVEEDKGIIDFIVDGQKSFENITRCTARMTEATLEIGAKFKQRTAEIEKTKKIAQRGRQSVAITKINKISTEAAEDISNYANKLEKEQPIYHSAWELFDENINSLLKITQIKNEKDLEESKKFHIIICELQSAVKGVLKTMRIFRDTIDGLRGISQKINQASSRTLAILDPFISEFESSNSYCTKVMTLLEEKIEKGIVDN